MNRTARFMPACLLLIALSPFIYWIYTYINHDAWWDEIVSLTDYTLVELKKTVTTYTVPNNHILFNLINNVLLKTWGINDIYVVLDKIMFLRLLQTIIASVTILYSVLIIRRFFDKKYSFLAVAFLVTTIPFLNFSLQLRGYNLSMMLFVIVIYHTWHYLDYRKVLDLIIFSFTTFCLIYTLPSNVYVMASFAMTIPIGWFINRQAINRFTHRKKKKKHLSRKLSQENKETKKMRKQLDRSYLFIILAGIIALSMIYLAYTPVMHEVLDNKFVNSTPRNRIFAISTLLPQILDYFLSNRWLILIGIPGFIWIVYKRRKNNHNYTRLAALILVLFLPFIFILIHNKVPFQRTLIVLTPVFSIILSIIFIRLFESLKLKTTLKWSIISLFTIYLVTNSFLEISKNNCILKSNLNNDIREQNIYRNYYLCCNFRPKMIAEKIAQMGKNQVILIDEIDRPSLMQYLGMYNINSKAVIRIQKKETKINNKTFHYIALVTETTDNGKKNVTRNIPCDFSKEYLDLNNYKFQLDINSQMNPKEKLTVLSGYNKRMNRTKDYMKWYTFNQIDTLSFVHLYEVERKH